MIPLSASAATTEQTSEVNDSASKPTHRKTNYSQDYITLNLYFDSSTLCQIIDKLLSGSENPYLALVVRTDVVTHPDQYANLRRTLEYVLNHRLVGQLAFETPGEMIMRRK